MWLKPSCSCICLLFRWVCVTIMTGIEIVSRDNFFPSDPTQKVRALCSASKFKIKREGFLHRGSFCFSFYWLLPMMNHSDLIIFSCSILVFFFFSPLNFPYFFFLLCFQILCFAYFIIWTFLRFFVPYQLGLNGLLRNMNPQFGSWELPFVSAVLALTSILHLACWWSAFSNYQI